MLGARRQPALPRRGLAGVCQSEERNDAIRLGVHHCHMEVSSASTQIKVFMECSFGMITCQRFLSYLWKCIIADCVFPFLQATFVQTFN